MGKKYRTATKTSKGVAILLRGIGTLLIGSNIWISAVPERMVVLGVVVGATQ